MTHMHRVLLVVLVAACLGVAAIAQAEEPKLVERIGPTVENPADARAREILKTKTLTFTFDKNPVMEALAYLSATGGVNIVPDQRKFEDPEQTITIKMTNVPLGVALDFVCEQIGMKYVVRDGVVFISDEEGVRLPPVTAVYDVRGLLRPGEVVTSALENDTREALAELKDLIMSCVAPGTWDEGGGNSLRGYAVTGSLVVVHTPDAHRRIVELLDMLAQAKARADATPRPKGSLRRTAPEEAQPID